MMQGIHQREGKTQQTWSVMVVAFLALFSQIGAMVLLISPEWIKLESCACVQIEARGAGNRWVHSIRYFCFIRKAGYCIVKKSLPFWSSFWISFAILPPISAILPRWRVSLYYFLLALWVILGETNYMTHLIHSEDFSRTMGMAPILAKRARKTTTITDQVCCVSPTLLQIPSII